MEIIENSVFKITILRKLTFPHFDFRKIVFFFVFGTVFLLLFIF